MARKNLNTRKNRNSRKNRNNRKNRNSRKTMHGGSPINGAAPAMTNAPVTTPATPATPVTNNSVVAAQSGGRKRTMSSGATKWRDHMMKVYREMKSRNPATRLGDAMRAAKKSYK